MIELSLSIQERIKILNTLSAEATGTIGELAPKFRIINKLRLPEDEQKEIDFQEHHKDNGVIEWTWNPEISTDKSFALEDTEAQVIIDSLKTSKAHNLFEIPLLEGLISKLTLKVI